MSNVVKFTMNNVPAGLDSMYVRVEEDVLTQGVRSVLYSGVAPVSGNAIEVNIGDNGVVGNGAIVSADNYTSGGSAFKSMSGYSLIEAGGVPPTGYLIEGDRLKVIAFGDSITEAGDSQRRNLAGNYAKTTTSYWANALNNTGQDFYVLDGWGVASDTTVNLLSRMDDVLLSGADIVIIMIGTNDLLADTPIQTISDNMANILDQIIAAGMKVIIQPVIHRRPDTPFEEGYNDRVDQLNASYRGLVTVRSADVDMAGDPISYNQLLVDNPPLVTTDGIHPISYGAWHIGQTLSPVISSRVLSKTPVGDLNYATGLTGTTGELRDGATGQVPDGWRLYDANPAVGVGGTVNGDGTYTVLTGLDAGGGENNSKVLFITAPLDAGSYIFSIDLSIDDISKLESEFKVTIRQGFVNESSTFRIFQSSELPENSMDFSGGVRILLNRITIAATETITIEIEGSSKPTEQVTYTLGNPELRKVG